MFQFFSEHYQLPGFLRLPYQLKNLELCPGVHSNLNKPQLYLKNPGSRMDSRLEKIGLGLVNHNFGSDSCLWYGVPFEYTFQHSKA
ncbi:hypothetical protein B9Z55_027540 [Caenorhabditis nigoni]|uniref:Uncharacterized protein n=1 Tax=Caenorhabditis nigoni TaxID=1611254 RepID=A0A2G5SFI4_9PELO|nr:hypothetical protein B9Z55_027540 [Caenorhabditis nigoni]